MGDYLDLYVQLDTLLLGDVFENFRNMCIKIYDLDPSYFYSAPGLAWKACLKKTGVKLELLADNDMLLMVEKGNRGGMCQATHKYAKANNKYMKNYDANQEASYLEYLDANNLYGWSMSKKLPVNNFEWMTDISDVNEDFIKIYDENSDKGYILEVDIDYLKKLSKLHSDLPFLPRQKNIGKVEKLICAIEDVNEYVINILALKQALNNGLKLNKVHRVITFYQKSWLKPYIDMKTELRKQAKNEFEKNFFKLMNKSVFGKTIENVRKNKDIKLVTSEKKKKA